MTREEAYKWCEETNDISERGECDGCGHVGRVVNVFVPDSMGIPTWVLSYCEKCGGVVFTRALSRHDAHNAACGTRKLAEARRAENRRSRALVANPDSFVSDEERWEDEWNEYGDAMVA